MQAGLQHVRAGPVAGQAMNRAGQERGGNGESPQAAALRIGKGTGSRPSGSAGSENSETSGFDRRSSVPSESRMPARAPVTNLWQSQSQDRAARG